MGNELTVTAIDVLLSTAEAVKVVNSNELTFCLHSSSTERGAGEIRSGLTDSIGLASTPVTARTNASREAENFMTSNCCKVINVRLGSKKAV
jgi:hypothetical protein